METNGFQHENVDQMKTTTWKVKENTVTSDSSSAVALDFSTILYLTLMKWDAKVRKQQLTTYWPK